MCFPTAALLPANSLPLPVAGIALASIALASIALASIALASTAFRRHTRPQDRHDDTTHFSLATASSYPMYPKMGKVGWEIKSIFFIIILADLNIAGWRKLCRMLIPQFS